MGAPKGVAMASMGVTLRGWEGPGRCGSLREEDARASSHRQPYRRCRPRPLPPGPTLAAASAPPTSGPPTRPEQGLGGARPSALGSEEGWGGVPFPPHPPPRQPTQVARPVPGLPGLERDPTP
jgi:hypothetical protein